MDQRVTDLPQRAPEGTAGSAKPKHRAKTLVRAQFRILPIHCRDSIAEFLPGT